jgi:hypothetical protein
MADPEQRSHVMRLLIVGVLGSLAGIVAGLVLSEVIGIVGYLATGDAVGIKFLPLYLAVVLAVVAPLIDARRRRRTHAS